MSDRKRHPSGRPIRNDWVVGKQIWRIPDKGAVIPRLQDEKSSVSAIGFTAQIVADDDE
jgi:hypothetical protein